MSDAPVANEPVALSSTWDVLKRGWATSPELRKGAGVTVICALIGAGGQSLIPVLVQQMFDRDEREEW